MYRELEILDKELALTDMPQYRRVQLVEEIKSRFDDFERQIEWLKQEVEWLEDHAVNEWKSR